MSVKKFVDKEALDYAWNNKIKPELNKKALKENTYTKDEVDAKVSSVYKYKGSVANKEALPTEDLTVGDVYNLEDTGMNVGWTGSDWDNLGSVLDLTDYAKKSDFVAITNSEIDEMFDA